MVVWFIRHYSYIDGYKHVLLNTEAISAAFVKALNPTWQNMF